MEWLIDIIKEWVEDKLYATEAWVTEWFTPYSVTGPLNPNATCLYFKAGTHDGKPYYRRSDGEWFLWWDSPQSWVISSVVGSLVPISWFRVDPNIEGSYLEGVAGTGVPTVSLGYRSLCTSFVDRGDPAAYDWDLTDLTIDGAWHDLDLSGIVPAGAKSVLLSLYVKATAINKSLTLRKNGNVNTVNSAGIIPPVANVFYRNDSTVACDTDRKIEYAGSAGFFNAIYISVRNWWF